MSALIAIGCGVTQGKDTAEKAVGEFQQRRDSREFGEIYRTAHPDFQKTSSEADFAALLAAVHTKLGPALSHEQENWHVRSTNLDTQVTLTYTTKFLEGDAVETFVFRIEGEEALLYGYNINSRDLITK